MGQEFQILGFNMFLISTFIFKNMIHLRLKKLTANIFFFLYPSNHVVKKFCQDTSLGNIEKGVDEKWWELVDH